MYLLQRPEDVPPRLTNRLNARIAVLAAVVIAAVAMVVLRLWSLQVLSGDHYRVLDRAGRVLVDNRTVMSLELRPSDLPSSKSERRAELHRLGSLLGLSQGAI